MRRWPVLLTLTLLIPGEGERMASAVPVEEPNAMDLAGPLRSLVEHLRGADVGVAVLDLETDKLLGAAGEKTLLNPASNAKLVTAALALSSLEPNFRYETTLSGALKGEAVVGPLVLRGFGDPSLRTVDLTEFAQGLRAMGVRRVEGDLLVDQRFFDDEVIPPAFEQQPDEWATFRAPVSAVSVNENTVEMVVRPTEEKSPARVSFEPPGFVEVEGTVATGGKGADNVRLLLEGEGMRLRAKISGTVSSDSRLVRYTRRVADPRLLAGYVLRSELAKAGLSLSGEVKLGAGSGRTLLVHKSAPLSELLYRVGKDSDNFYAEMIFKSVGGELKGKPAKSADAASLAMRFLEKASANEPPATIRNGSGLFDANRISALSMVRLLGYAYKKPKWFPEYLAELAVGGVDGTLQKRFRGERVRGVVRAKTGTLNDVIALSGYVLGRRPVAFSILMNKVGDKKDRARAAADKLVEQIARAVNPSLNQ